MTRSVAGPIGLTAGLAAIWLTLDPPSIDLAAQEYRAQLFRDEGFVATSPDWYGGFDVPGYSLLFPPLGAWLGVELLGALAAITASAVFALIAHRHAGSAGRLAAYWFAVAILTQLITGRITFTLGVAIGLGAIWAIQHRRRLPAFLLAALSAAASPVAGVFVALAGAAVVAGLVVERGAGDRSAPPLRMSSRTNRRLPFPVVAGSSAAFGAAGAAVLGAVAVIAAMAAIWPTGGVFPFATSAFLAVPLFVAAGLLVLPARMSVLRWGLVLYGVLAVAVFAFDNPFGANATRLGALFGGPVLALALWPGGQRGRRALVVLAVPLLYWQWVSSVDSLIVSSPDPLRDRARTAPLLREISARDELLEAGERVHVPPTRTRWEAKHVAEQYPLARGWLRQLESEDFELFTDSNLTPASYRDWLAEHDVALVAVPDASPDYLARDERRLIGTGLSYLSLEWSNADWRLYRVEPGRGRGPS